jgi:hypothetical protein
MNLVKTILISSLTVSSTAAFSTSNNTPPSPVKAESSRLQFLQTAFTAATAATTLTFIPQSASAASSDPFALPSYSDAIKNKSVDLNLEDVNKKIINDAAAKRDDSSVNRENNLRYIELKAEEAEEEKRMIRMKELAKREREERIAQEKAETKANRWNTF